MLTEIPIVVPVRFVMLFKFFKYQKWKYTSHIWLSCALCKFTQSWQGCSTPWWRRRQDPRCPHSLFHLGNLKIKQLEKLSVLNWGSYYLQLCGMHTVCDVMRKDHLFQRWHDQPVVCHWAVRLSWPHEDHGHWTLRPPTQPDALYRIHTHKHNDVFDIWSQGGS